MVVNGQFVFLVGAHKAGTTSVAHWLAQHRSIALARSKEPNVFATRSVTDPTDPYWKEFGSAPIKLDASTNYAKRLTYPGVAKRLSTFAPDAKIIYLTRDPLRRLWSAWRQHLDESGYPIARDFSTALRHDRSLLDATMYFDQLREYQDQFPTEQIFTCPMEVLLGDPAQQEQLLLFVGERPVGLTIEQLNNGEDKRLDPLWLDRVLGSEFGRRLGDTMRRTPLRASLAGFRRRMLLQPMDQEAESSLTWASVPGPQLVVDNARSYLASTGHDHSLWPSLRTFASDAAADTDLQPQREWTT